MDVPNVYFSGGASTNVFLAAKIEFSYGVVQSVNLLALRLQWFEDTPTHGSYRAILPTGTFA